ncbi:trehalose/maltose hydrolase or phosphorylase [Halobacteroides halobius DSM 5150]|uniref:Trehalose/maltose hydrolase or phosphorylase n=1 Tax=Halobacteroides halobius (strain ATCC 35273 / DSM 5150 / MD-1) TaxID=748449 RepID=L0KBN0_HALHC|nr:glycosyl hydrolase family 65 protein [Halobacteroides halobius]AGB41493.1 trehalose/maltose hydrolase or phosphorylase [Halobacteroides halobius DSM 5150]
MGKEKFKEAIYPYDEWKIREESFDIETNYRDETIFALGNGYIGMRGNFEEGYAGPKNTSLQGTYLNGFYESEPIIYGEEAYGYAQNSQTMLNVTDSKIIKLYLGDEEFSMFAGELLNYERTLDMKEGVLTRELTWQSPAGKKVAIKIKRIVCLTNKHLAAISYEVRPLNFSGEVTLVSALDGAVTNQVNEDDPRVGSDFQGQVLNLVDKEQKGNFAALTQKTNNTEFELVCGMENQLETESDFRLQTDQPEQMVRANYIVEAREEETINLTKYITYYTSRDYSADRLLPNAKDTLKTAKEEGFNKLLTTQKEYLAEFWQQAQVEIEGDKALQQGIRFNEYHLLQSVGKDGKTNIAAKGVTGEGYEGHYFWDTEIYSFPFFLYTKPEISKKLLEYRYNILDDARQRARTMSHDKGALFPWRTIAGEECSAYYPAGTAQYHINADVIYSLKRYMEATDDTEFMLNYGAEMLFETARVWADLGDYIPGKDNQFCINDVTGPDEYTAIVNNNCYTNYMAQMNLEYAYQIATWIKEKHPDVYRELKKQIELKEDEVTNWKEAADKMYIPYDEERKIHAQDDSFLDKAVWDFKNTPQENYPLLLNYHPLVIYRHQVLKQADTVLVSFLLGDKFDLEQKKRDFDYYEPLTTHDSSLSSCIYGIMAAEIGYHDKAYNFFMETARMDLDNYHDNSQHGVHTAAMAGTWLGLVNGFAGMRIYEGELSFDPYLPEKWDSYKFNVNFKGRRLEVEVTSGEVTYNLASGEELEFYHQDKLVSLEQGQKISCDLDGE